MMPGNPFDISGKNAVVTGAAMGIGFAVAKRFVEAGANVVIADLNQEAAEAAAVRLSEGSGRVVAVQTDVGREGSGRAVVDRCLKEFGSIDILVNNAGIFPLASMLNTTTEIFDRIYRVNLRGLAFFSQAAATAMMARGTGGKIINIASIDAFRPSFVGAAYDSSKGGVLMFTKSFALEMAPHGILVNAIAPGTIATEGALKTADECGMTQEQVQSLLTSVLAQIPLGRRGTPDDVAKVAWFLASPASDYITGEAIVVDGGWMLT
ncbi:MAG: SDR family oxidoreductase [bacterium]